MGGGSEGGRDKKLAEGACHPRGCYREEAIHDEVVVTVVVKCS